MKDHGEQEDLFWQPLLEEEPEKVAFFVHARPKIPTNFQLEPIVRQYCRSTIKPPLNGGGPSVIVVDMEQLYDILGLLRALQHDVSLYNEGLASEFTPNDRRYALHGLQRQASYHRVKLVANEQVEIPGMNSLVEYIESESKEKIEQAKTTLSQDCVDFESLVEYFSPGRYLLDTGLLTGLGHTPLMCRCRSSYYRRGTGVMNNTVVTFHATLECVVSLGLNVFAVVQAPFFQSMFDGTRPIKNTESMGLANEMLTLVQEGDNMWQILEERGSQYQNLCTDLDSPSTSSKLVSYTTGSFYPSQQASRPSRTSGRLVVDTTEAWSHGVHAAKAPADGMAGDAVVEAVQAYARIRRQQDSNPNKKDNSDMDWMDESQDILFLRAPLPQHLVTLTWPFVCGFSMESRCWGVALVDGLKAIEFKEDVFDNLVLPDSRKRLLRALILTHGSTAQTDVLQGKGEGLIFLLHGPPGVGKTLTAEAVAEVLHRPLYRVSMGELGTTPEELEKRLQAIFDLCVPWHALVLIDEAEMLLQVRGNDLIRSAMVCVMLRLLEYYPGILFLTTNKAVSDLDPAIISRITCSLGYQPLGTAGLLEIWKAAVGRVKDVEVQVTIADMEHFAEKYGGMNGRQIKTAVQLAVALCAYEEKPLCLEQLLETVELTFSSNNAKLE